MSYDPNQDPGYVDPNQGYTDPGTDPNYSGWYTPPPTYSDPGYIDQGQQQNSGGGFNWNDPSQWQNVLQGMNGGGGQGQNYLSNSSPTNQLYGQMNTTNPGNQSMQLNSPWLQQGNTDYSLGTGQQQYSTQPVGQPGMSDYNFGNSSQSQGSNGGADTVNNFGFTSITGKTLPTNWLYSQKPPMPQQGQSQDWTAQLPPQWQAAMKGDKQAENQLGWDANGPSGAPDFVRNPQTPDQWNQRYFWLGTHSDQMNNPQDLRNRQLGLPVAVDPSQFQHNVYGMRNAQRQFNELAGQLDQQGLANAQKTFGWTIPQGIPTYQNYGQALALANRAAQMDKGTDFAVTQGPNGFQILTRSQQYHPAPPPMPQQMMAAQHPAARYSAPARYTAPVRYSAPAPAPRPVLTPQQQQVRIGGQVVGNAILGGLFGQNVPPIPNNAGMEGYDQYQQDGANSNYLNEDGA